MFGISAAELLVIILVAVLVIPARHWGDVAKFVARCVTFVRDMIWKITDASEKIKDQIDLEKPIDDLLKTTTDDVLGAFSDALPKKKKDEGQRTKGKNKSKRITSHQSRVAK